MRGDGAGVTVPSGSRIAPVEARMRPLAVMSGAATAMGSA